MTRDPDWQALPRTTPPAVRRLLRRCLERDPKQRLRDVGDARLELAARATTEMLADVETKRTGLPAWTRRSLFLSPLLVSQRSPGSCGRCLLLEPFGVSISRCETSAPTRCAIRSFRPMDSASQGPAGGSLWIRDLDRPEPRVVARDVDPMHLGWSPDSGEVFFSDNRLWRVRTSGGDPVAIAEAGFRRGALTPGAAWLHDGRIVIAPAANATGLLVVPAHGGEFQTLFEPPDGVSDYHSPSVLPADRGVLVVVDRVREGADSIQVVADGRLLPIIEAKGERFEAPMYSPTGHLVYERTVAQRGIWAVPFALDRLAVTGEPFLVAANGSWPSVSADGTLVHTRADAGSSLELVVLDRANGRRGRSVGPPSRCLLRASRPTAGALRCRRETKPEAAMFMSMTSSRATARASRLAPMPASRSGCSEITSYSSRTPMPAAAISPSYRRTGAAPFACWQNTGSTLRSRPTVVGCCFIVPV